MAETITVAEYKKLIQQKDKPKQSKPKKQPDLVERIDALLKPLGWQCGLYRTLCEDERSPENTAETTAKNNAVSIFRSGRERHISRTAHLGWIWDVEKMSDEQVLARVREIEKGAA